MMMAIYLKLKQILPDRIWKKICPHRWGGRGYVIKIKPGIERRVLDCHKCEQTVWGIYESDDWGKPVPDEFLRNK